MKRLLAFALALPLGAGVPADAGAGASDAGRLAWSFSAAAGYDTYVQRFPLAGEDTTETISEFDVTLAAEARTMGRARHHWWLRPEISAGTELARERIEAGWQLRPDSAAAVLRLDARWHARQYRGGTEYNLSSDAQEGRIEARGVVSPRGAHALETRAYGAWVRYAEPTELELDMHEAGALVSWRSGHDAPRLHALGVRLARRAYPDSAAVDRTMAALEGEFDTAGLAATGLRGWLHAERRAVRDEAARPSAWAGWGGLDWLVPAGRGRVQAELQLEWWDYDDERSAWFDSWRVGGALLWRAGEPGWGTGWLAGVAAERLDAGAESPETYNQAGLRVGAETVEERLTGTLTLEVGRRDYVYQPPETPLPTANALASPLDLLALYSDFTYWRLWLSASWRVSGRVAFDVSANYEPEDHTEEADDSAVAFASARLVWRW